MTNKNLRFRRLVRWMISNLIKAAIFALLLLIYIFQVEPRWYDIHQIDLVSPNLPTAFDRYKIVQLTDFHVDNLRDSTRLQKIVELTNQQQPNLVVMTGDFITGALFDRPKVSKEDVNSSVAPYQTMPFLDVITVIVQTLGIGPNKRLLEPDLANKFLPIITSGLQQIHAPDGILAVLGNHDRWQQYKPQFLQSLQSLGVQVLENDLTQIRRGKDLLQIAGVNDFLNEAADLQPILTKLGPLQGNILLAHEPDFADLSAATGKFDLQLSGHSHGGQVYIPGLRRITPPLAHEYPAGQYQVKQMTLYTSRGLGMVTPRIRFNCRPEITVVTLRSKSSKNSTKSD